MEEPDPDTALASVAFHYVNLGVAHGLSREALMAAAGLEEQLRGDPDARVSTFAYIVLWRELLVGLPQVAVPVEAVRAFDVAALGVVGQILARVDDIAHAAALSERFSRLTDTGIALRWLDRDGQVGYSISHRPEVVAMRFPIEVMLGTGYRIMCHPARCCAITAARSSTSRSSSGTPTSRGSTARFGAGPARRPPSTARGADRGAAPRGRRSPYREEPHGRGQHPRLTDRSPDP